MQAAINLAVDASAGMQRLHARGFVHRDARPPNIVQLADAEDRFMLIDLEAAARIDAEMDVQVGTRSFRAAVTDRVRVCMGRKRSHAVLRRPVNVPHSESAQPHQ